MTKTQLQNRLTELIELEKQYQFINDTFFKTNDEFEQFQQTHRQKIDELKAIISEQREIKWKLMPEQERQEYLDYIKAMKVKHEGE